MEKQKYVSRAGYKLEQALETWNINLKNKVCADFGSNKGGFVDCMLQKGAKKVYAVETGYGVLDYKLRIDARVIVMERTNAMHVELAEKVDFISIDTSWTPQKYIVKSALHNLKNNGDIVSLLKTHYEADKKYLIKGTLKQEFIEKVVDNTLKELKHNGVKVFKILKSSIQGEKGKNIEYLLWIKP
jgi:23S rRNA (cytidine1920-2'-O)/16S rRNA (cytidine1409-2'-O)-methyltransferase